MALPWMVMGTLEEQWLGRSLADCLTGVELKVGKTGDLESLTSNC